MAALEELQQARREPSRLARALLQGMRFDRAPVLLQGLARVGHGGAEHAQEQAAPDRERPRDREDLDLRRAGSQRQHDRHREAVREGRPRKQRRSAHDHAVVAGAHHRDHGEHEGAGGLREDHQRGGDQLEREAHEQRGQREVHRAASAHAFEAFEAEVDQQPRDDQRERDGRPQPEELAHARHRAHESDDREGGHAGDREGRSPEARPLHGGVEATGPGLELQAQALDGARRHAGDASGRKIARRAPPPAPFSRRRKPPPARASRSAV